MSGLGWPPIATLGHADAPGLLALSESVGWPHSSEDWAAILEAGQVFGHRGAAGAPMSSAALFDYGAALVSLGMVLVAPSHRRRGLARAVMEHCLRLVAPRPMTLIATPQGEPLYVGLGFVEVERVHRMVGQGALNGDRLPPIAQIDADAVARLDHAAFGADRRALLRILLARAAATAVVRDAHGRARAFGIATRQRDQLVVGPLIATDTADAAALFQSLTADVPDPVRIDVPVRQGEFLASLAGLGLRAAGDAPIMLHGAHEMPGRRNGIYAIAVRAFG